SSWSVDGAASLREVHGRLVDRYAVVEALLHTIEAISERDVFSAYGVHGDDLAAVIGETGMPAGWRPLLQGYDSTSPLTANFSNLHEAWETARVRELRGEAPFDGLGLLKQKLRASYESGFGGAHGESIADDEEQGSGGSSADE